VGPPARKRIRGAMPMASLAAFVVLIGASAAYGLSAGGASNVKDLGVGPKPPAPSTIAEATPTPPPATTSPTPDTVPQATPTPPPSTPAPTPKPSKKAKAKTPATTTPSTPSTPSSTPSTPSTGGGTPTHHHHTTHHHTAPTGPPSWFADADQPSDASGWGAGGASKAIDGSLKTAWTSGSTGTGVVIDDGKFQPYNDVGIATSTPGFAVTIYAKDQNNGSGNPSASGWKRVGHASSVAKYQQIPIALPNNPPEYLLIYVTKLPSGGKASINEVKLVL
jgi:hypothetical protein